MMVHDLGKRAVSFDADDSDVPDHMRDVSNSDCDDLGDMSFALEREADQKAYIFSGIPPEGTVSRLETFFGTIQQAREGIAKSGAGLYAPRDPEGLAILDQTRDRVIGIPTFRIYQAEVVKQTVERVNSSPISGFEFIQQSDGSFILVEKANELVTSDGGIVQDLEADSNHEETEISRLGQARS